MQQPWDVIVVGAGPGGLQTAIAAASEGLRTLVLEKGTVGGQIGQTPKLENSVFANGGITGPEFARMMREQTEAMGATIASGTAVYLDGTRAGANRGAIRIGVLNGDDLFGRTVVLAMGNKWTELDIPGLRPLVNDRAFIGPVKSIKYAGHDEPVVVYGGGPSAGQAVLALADNPAVQQVYHLMRSGFKMPKYLVDRIVAHPKVKVVEGVIERMNPCGRHDVLVDLHLSGNRALTVEAVFLCNGLTPATDWLRDSGVKLTETGHVINTDLETDIPGVFAIGDCRAGSTARVGVAIGDGSMAVTKIWRYFARHPVCDICPQVFNPRQST